MTAWRFISVLKKYPMDPYPEPHEPSPDLSLYH